MFPLVGSLLSYGQRTATCETDSARDAICNDLCLTVHSLHLAFVVYSQASVVQPELSGLAELLAFIACVPIPHPFFYRNDPKTIDSRAVTGHPHGQLIPRQLLAILRSQQDATHSSERRVTDTADSASG